MTAARTRRRKTNHRRQNGTCFYCGHRFRFDKQWTFDHVLPKAFFNTAPGAQAFGWLEKHHWTRKIGACIDCNQSKADTMPSHHDLVRFYRLVSRWAQPNEAPICPAIIQLVTHYTPIKREEPLNRAEITAWLVDRFNQPGMTLVRHRKTIRHIPPLRSSHERHGPEPRVDQRPLDQPPG